jgi:hypothetical protein
MGLVLSMLLEHFSTQRKNATSRVSTNYLAPRDTVVTGSARHLYVVCIYGAICLQIQKYFPPDPAIFPPKNKIFILLYIVYRFIQNISIFHGITARYDVLKIKFVDISHHRYKLRTKIE